MKNEQFECEQVWINKVEWERLKGEKCRGEICRGGKRGEVRDCHNRRWMFQV